MWRRYRHLYAGGEAVPRTRGRIPGAAAQRAAWRFIRNGWTRVFYENYLGSIVDWYAATLVRREPDLEFTGTNDRAKEFLAHFAQNCDQRGTTLTQFFKQQITEALVCGKSYVVVDFPKAQGQARTRADEDASGLSRAYLMPYGAEELINWSYDAKGELEWVVIRTSWLKQDSVRSSGWKREKRWIYYDRERFEIYARRDGDATPIELVDEGRHGFAGIGRVPVFELSVSEGLWLTNKIALLQLEHFNKSNALGWALTMGLFAMPVIYSDREFNQITGESYYIQLGPDDRFGWTEPSGNVYQIAADNLTRLKDEIYRVSYLMQQASGASAGAAVGAEPAVGLQRHAGDSAGVRRRGEGLDAQRAVGDCGGAAGRAGGGRYGDGRIRHHGLQHGCGGCEESAGAGDSVADADATGAEASGDEVSVRCAAGDQEPDRGRDRCGAGAGGLAARGWAQLSKNHRRQDRQRYRELQSMRRNSE